MTNKERALLVGPADLWDMKREFQINFLKEVGMKPEHSLFDMGCGVLRGGIPIIEYLDAGNYTGFEVRDYVLEEGKAELQEAGLEHKNPFLLCEDTISDLVIVAQFDYIWAFSVLIHMTDEIVLECLQFAQKHLKDDGEFFANVSIGQPKVNEWMEFPVLRRSIGDYEKLASRAGLTVSSIGTLGELGHVSDRPAQDAHHMLVFTKG